MSAEHISPAPDFLSVFSSIRDQLACPVCQGELGGEPAHLVCRQCGRAYPIVDGIPVLVPPAEESVS